MLVSVHKITRFQESLFMNARVPPNVLQPALALERVSQAWDNDIVRQLTDYIAIPAKSPMFSPD